MISLILVDLCLTRSSSKKLPPATDAETHSETLDRPWGTPQKRVRKNYESQRGQGHQENTSHKIN